MRQRLLRVVAALMLISCAACAAQAGVAAADAFPPIGTPFTGYLDAADSTGVVPASANVGDPAAIAALQLQLVLDVQTDRSVMATLTLPVPPTLQVILGGVLSSSTLVGDMADKQAAVAAAALDPAYQPYIAETFSVTEWQGVHVNGGNATAVLIGHDSYLNLDGTWSTDPDGQWQYQLANEGGIWKLSSQNGVSLDEVPPTGLSAGA